ncbi:DUF2251 domain-containing protein [Pinirhizobacter soli]|uniref:DUF2251 domain-containing protein n=1 Tax=Pinirhizobacter soli TaxID=2786953 RepID=UPI00202A7739|nr:DUF2251 domain-containing protein [Pinirhizobacter soli]
MTKNDIFESELNSNQSVAGVYEHDDDVGYFYLYELAHHEGQKVTGAIRVSVGPFQYGRDDLSIRWSNDEGFVGLFIKGKLCAAFDVNSRKAFGDGPEHSEPIPESVKNVFRNH